MQKKKKIVSIYIYKDGWKKNVYDIRMYKNKIK